MSFQAYLDAVEKQTGKTPQQIVDEAAAAGLGPDTRPGRSRRGSRRRTASGMATPTASRHRHTIVA